MCTAEETFLLCYFLYRLFIFFIFRYFLWNGCLFKFSFKILFVNRYIIWLRINIFLHFIFNFLILIILKFTALWSYCKLLSIFFPIQFYCDLVKLQLLNRESFNTFCSCNILNLRILIILFQQVIFNFLFLLFDNW